jgi:hypothetical protein
MPSSPTAWRRSGTNAFQAGSLDPRTNNGIESSWNVMAHVDAREGKWRGNWRMEWVANNLHTTSERGVSSITMRTRRLSIGDWTDAPADLNGLVRFAERRNLVSGRVPSQFKRSLLVVLYNIIKNKICFCMKRSIPLKRWNTSTRWREHVRYKHIRVCFNIINSKFQAVFVQVRIQGSWASWNEFTLSQCIST